MTNLGTVTVGQQTSAPAPPVEITIAYTAEDEARELTVQATAWVPFAHLVDFWTAPKEAATPAGLAFLGRCLLPDSWTAFYALITDPTSGVDGPAVADVIRKLLTYYETVDPTTARTVGPKPSAKKRQPTGRGSSGSPRGKASTSR